jgi:ribonuclease P protein subunit RPR2
MAERSRKKPEYQIQIARERIEILFSEAKKAPDDLGRRYMRLAKKIGMRYNVKLGPQKKKLFCKHCFTPFGGAKSRLKDGYLVRECKNCKRITKMKYK